MEGDLDRENDGFFPPNNGYTGAIVRAGSEGSPERKLKMNRVRTPQWSPSPVSGLSEDIK